jgi:hypothetical protein
MIFGSSVEGIADVNRRIEAMKPRLQRATQRALDASGQKLLNDAKARATSSHVKRSLIIHEPSPNIRTLTVAPGEFVTDRVVRKRLKSGRKSKRTYQPDETVRFYRFLELGTKFHAAKPFMVPAIVSFRASGLTTFSDHFKI